MKSMKLGWLIALALIVMSAGAARAASTDDAAEQSDAAKMMHKLGRGVVNVFTCWVEVPKNIAKEWDKMDPVSGTVVGFFEGFGWGFARFATGVYDTFTFLLPVPADYQPLMTPEFIVTDVWGDPIPGFDETSTAKPNNTSVTPSYPQQFSY